MSTTYVATGFGQTDAPMRRVLRFFERYWGMLREWQRRDTLRGALYNLSDRDLQDIGTTRCEIEYVARSGSASPTASTSCRAAERSRIV
jgi:uncharacterized protein YjiS (DUF1127 family)